jgi:hypothetical protein
MSRRSATTAVRRRWRVCKAYARQPGYPRRAREARRPGGRDSSTRSYRALDGRGGAGGLELTIIRLLVESPGYPRQFSEEALSEPLAPAPLLVVQASLRRLEQQGIIIRDRDGFALSRPVRGLVALGLIERV